MFLVLLGVQFCFASFPVAGKIALEGFSASAIVGWRIVAASIALSAFAWLRFGRKALLPLRTLPLAAILSLLGVSANQILFVEALSRSTAIKGGLLVTLIPVMTWLFAVVLRRERVDLIRAIGVLLAFAGTARLFLGGPRELHDGDVLYLANSALYSLYLVFVRALLTRHHPIVVAAWMFVLSLPAVPWLFTRGSAIPAAADAGAWLALAWIVVFPTILSYLGNAWALARVASSVAAIFICIQPVIATTLAVVVRGERLGPDEGIMAACAITGVILVTRRRAEA